MRDWATSYIMFVFSADIFSLDLRLDVYTLNRSSGIVLVYVFRR